MCGIVFVKKSQGQPAYKTVIKRFQAQRGRGTEGFGYIAVENNRVVSLQRAKNEEDIIDALKDETASEILFHHRLPTSTPNFIGATHPLIIQDERFKFDYVVVHNGVVTNCDELKKEHEKLDLKYITEYGLETVTRTEISESLVFADGYVEMKDKKTYKEDTKIVSAYNDSESLAFELALVCEGWKNGVETRGGLSVIFYQLNKDGKNGIIGASVNRIFYASNSGRPLVIEKQGKKKHRNEMTVIKSQGDGVDIKTDLLHSVYYDDDGAHVESVKVKLGTFYQTTVHTPSKNVHQNRVGFHRDDYTSPEDSYLGGYRGGKTIEDEEEDYDKKLAKEEKELVDSLEKSEAKAWQEKARELVEEITTLRETIKELKKQYKDSSYENHDIQLEIELFIEELKTKEEDYLGVVDTLVEYNVPIPSQYTPIITY